MAPRIGRWILTITCLLAVASAAGAVTPEDTTYQGWLLDLLGDPLVGPVDIELGVWDSPVGGTQLYYEFHQNVPLTDGIFSILIGTGQLRSGTFDAALFAAENRYLEVVVDTEVLDPRQPFSSVAYAFQAQQCVEADLVAVGGVQTTMLADQAVTAAKIGTGEIHASHLITGAVGAEEIADGSVSSAEVDFDYAGSPSKGGPASDLACLACVSQGELDFTPGDITAVTAGSGLTGGATAGEAQLEVSAPLSLSISSYRFNAISGTQVSGAGGYGVYGSNTGSGNSGYLGGVPYGVQGEHASGNLGYLGSANYGARGENQGGHYGYLGGANYGVRGQHASGNLGYLGSANYGARGENQGGHYGYLGGANYGVRGQHASGNYGYLGSSNRGVFGYSAAGTAGYFDSPSGVGLVVDRGPVGIGTTSPEAELEVSGEIRITPDSSSKLRVGRYSSASPFGYLSAGGSADQLRLQIGDSTKMVIDRSGAVGIGTTSPNNKLDVAGTIRAEEVVVDTGWADHVFEDDYVRMGLDQLDAFIEREGHLPGIPSEAEVEANGIGVGELQVMLLEKVEELTLHLIEQSRAMREQDRSIRALKQELAALQSELSSHSASEAR